MFFNGFFNSQTKTITSAAGILAISSLISQFLGLIRDRILANRFGAGSELDAYFAAFRIPDLVYGILIIGGITAAFLPTFSEYFKKNKEEGWKISNNVLNCLLASLIIICLFFFIFTPYLVKLITPGFSPDNKALTVVLTRIMFLSPILLGLSAIFSSILQYFNRFFVYSLAPIFYNLGIILGIIFFIPFFGPVGLAFGVILGAFLHLLIQVLAVKDTGFHYLPILNFREPGLKQIFRLTIPRIFGVAASHLNLIVITTIASTLSIGSIAVFNFANNLQNIPIGLLGISFAIAAFPTLSKTLADGEKEEFSKNFFSISKKILYFAIPISILMIILKDQIIKLILKTGQFGFLETKLTAAALALFSLGVFASALIPLILRTFFALKDTKTPTIIAFFTITINIILSFYFTSLLKTENIFQNFLRDTFDIQQIKEIAVLGLPLAFSVATIFQFFLLIFFLRKKLEIFEKSF